MPLQNLADHLKTTPTNAPPSLGAVRNQLRFWGMGQSTGSGRALPELQARMGKYQLDAQTRLAQLQRRASEMQIGAERANMAVQAGMDEDQSAINHTKLGLQEDNQNEDLLSMASRATAGLVGLGKATRVVASAAGLKGVQSFMEKLPLIGKTKKTREMESMQAKILDAYEEGNIERIGELSEMLDYKMDFLVASSNLRTSLKDLFPDEDIDKLLGVSDIEEAYTKINRELTSMIFEQADPFATRNINMLGFGGR